MSEVLVVAELLDGAVTKPTLELLTLARRLGDPVAVVFGDGAEAASDRSASTGRPGSSRSPTRPSRSSWSPRRRRRCSSWRPPRPRRRS